MARSQTYVDKGRGYEHTGTKVLARKEGSWGNLHPLDLLGHDRKPSAEAREAHYQDWHVLLE